MRRHLHTMQSRGRLPTPNRKGCKSMTAAEPRKVPSFDSAIGQLTGRIAQIRQTCCQLRFTACQTFEHGSRATRAGVIVLRRQRLSQHNFCSGPLCIGVFVRLNLCIQVGNAIAVSLITLRATRSRGKSSNTTYFWDAVLRSLLYSLL